MTAPDQGSRVFCSVREGDSRSPSLGCQAAHDALLKGFRCSRAFPPRPAANAASKARLANSISQGVRRNPPDGGTPEFLPHRFQIIHFAGATLASPEMQLASQRIRRIQFSVKKSVQDQFPIRTGAGRARTGFGLRRPDHGNAHRVAERERQLADLTMTLPFMFGWIEHK